MNNNILRLAILVTKFIRALDVFLGALLAFFMIAWPLGAGFFDSITMVDDGSIFKFETAKNAEGVPLSEYGTFYFYFLCLRAMTLVVILYLILQTVLKVIRSISSLKTFQMENIESFRLMGKYFLLWFLVTIPSLKFIGSSFQIGIGLNFKYAVFGLICFVLAEIFSEGNKLMEENNLTI